MKTSADKKVVFNSEDHSYKFKNKNLTSVTTLVELFKNKFDSEYWSKKIAQKENTTQEQILKIWKEKAFKSTEIGTAIHKIFEDFHERNYSIVNGCLDFDRPKINSEYFLTYLHKRKTSIRFIEDFFLTKRLTTIESEYIVYNDVLAGQIDMVCKDQKGNYYIIDFKTNEKIETFSYGKKMKHLFNHVNDSNYFHYCLQLSIYKHILNKYPIHKMYIVHITENDYNIIECEDLLSEIGLKNLYKYIL